MKYPLGKVIKELNAEYTWCIFRRQYREEVLGKWRVQMFGTEIS